MSLALRKENLLVDELAELARAYGESQAFVSVLAHELRTRLKVTERALASEAGRETALENTRSVQGLLETMLELARGRAGKPADTAAAVGRVLEDLRDHIELQGTKIVTGPPARPPPARPARDRPPQPPCERARSRRLEGRDLRACRRHDLRQRRRNERATREGDQDLRRLLRQVRRRRPRTDAMPRDPAPPRRRHLARAPLDLRLPRSMIRVSSPTTTRSFGRASPRCSTVRTT